MALVILGDNPRRSLFLDGLVLLSTSAFDVDLRLARGSAGYKRERAE
jgi:hypothetical protein